MRKFDCDMMMMIMILSDSTILISHPPPTQVTPAMPAMPGLISL